MKGLLIFLGGYWFVCFWLGASMFLTGCAIGGYEAYGGIRSIDSRKVVEETLPARAGFSDRFWGLFDGKKEGAK